MQFPINNSGFLDEAALGRFLEKVQLSDGPKDCWLWTGALHPYGGFMMPDHTTRGAHRVAFELAKGPIPEETNVCHTCDEPACVRPKHLFLGTHADNVADKTAKGRQSKGETHGRALFTEDEVVTIRERIDRGEEQSDLAEEYDASLTAINAIVLGHNWPEAGGPIQQSRRLADEKISLIERLLDEGLLNQKEIASRAGCDPSNVSRIKKRKERTS